MGFPASPTQANTNSGTGASVTISLPSAPTAGNLLVVSISLAVNALTITPPANWSQAGSYQSSGSVITDAMFYLKNVPGGTGSSFTFTQSGTGGWAVAIEEWPGADTSAPLDVSGSTSGSSTTPSSGSVTTSGNGELVIAGVVYHQTAQTESGLTSGWTEDKQVTGGANTLDMLHHVQTSAGADSVGFTIGISRAWAGVIAAFKPASSGTAWNEALSDAHSAVDGANRSTSKPLTEVVSEQDTLTKGIFPAPFADVHSALDTFSRVWQAHLQLLDGISQLDALSKMPAKTLLEWLAATDSVTAGKLAGTAWVRNLSDTHSALDVLLKTPGKWTKDSISAVDLFSRVWQAHLTLQDWLIEADAWAKTVVKPQGDVQSGQDSFSRQVNYFRQYVDSLSQQDQLTVGRTVLLKLLDAAGLTDQVSTLLQHPIGQLALAQVISLVSAAMGMSISLLVGSGLSQLISLLASGLSQTLRNL